MARADWRSGVVRHRAGKDAEELLLWQVRIAAQRDPDLSGAVTQYKFHETRGWLLDFALPRWRVGVEIHGGIFSQGGHSRGARQIKDWEKLNEAQLAGWILITVPTDAVKKGEALVLVERAVRARHILVDYR